MKKSIAIIKIIRIKKVNLILLLFCFIIFAENTGCQKDPILGSNSGNTDGSGGSGSGNTNKPPKARAGNDTAIFLPSNRVILDGSSSTDPDSNIATYRWSKMFGPGSISITNPNSAITEVTNLVKGNYEFLLTVFDRLGEESLDIIRVSVVDSTSPPPPGNRPPSAYSGYDLIIHLPKDTGYLHGGGNDPDNNIATIQWSKIAGPASFNIVQPDKVYTRITNLERGVYKFEITVVDSLGLSARDTNTVIVGELPQNPQERILSNQGWSCHWDCYIQIDRLYDNIPPDKFFKVFIKRDNSSTWIEVVPSNEMIQSSIYGYYLRKGTLWIHQTFHTGWDISDTPDIKIVY